MRRALLLLLVVLLGCQVLGCGPRHPSLPQGRVYFKTADGVKLSGSVYGQGDTAVLLAHSWGSNEYAWRPFAQQLAERNYTVLAFNFRGYGKSEGQRSLDKGDVDERAALEYLRQHGFKRVICMGSSFGGFAAIRAAHEPGVIGLVALSAPVIVETAGEITAADLDTSYPKLFVGSDGDRVVEGTAQQFYAMAAEPKQLKAMPGTGHGTELLYAENDLRATLLAFVGECH